MAVRAPADGRLGARLVVLLFLLEYIRATHAQWTSWSAWSECSRTCDGGASYQLRRCPGRIRCAGRSIRYQTCNNKPCPEGGRDFRSQQCAAYNDVLYEGRLYEWVPQPDPPDHCSLRCQAAGHTFSVMLAPKVLDGTRCDSDRVDMCINGVCRAVGCDGVLGSTARIDDCGVCGGHGDTCQRRGRHTPFRWVQTEASLCSVTCGVGYIRTSVVCKDSRDGRVVYDRYCSGRATKPKATQKACKMPPCKPVWITGEWQACSKPCSGGISRRHIYCVELSEGRFLTTYTHMCTEPRPSTERACNEHACPRWYAGSWSPCSVTCGTGIQRREVICRRTQQHGCQLTDRPPTRRSCNTYVTCMGQKAEAQRNHSAQAHSQFETETAMEKSLQTTLTEPNATNQEGIPPPLNVEDQRIVEFLTKMMNESSKSVDLPFLGAGSNPGPPISGVEPPHLDLEDPQNVTVRFLESKEQSTNKHYMPDAKVEKQHYALGMSRSETIHYLPGAGPQTEGSGEEDEEGLWSPDGDLEPRGLDMAQENALDDERVSSIPSFVTSEWSPCSITCGFGIRSRLVVCKVYLKFSQTVQDLPEDSCSGDKPQEVEQCQDQLCAFDWQEKQLGGRQTSFMWIDRGDGPCNATCLGGFKEPIFRCIKVGESLEVPDDFCSDIPKPAGEITTCNNVPCPPRWRVDTFGPCSALCGGGHKRRDVDCIQELGHGEKETVILADDKCPQPIPARSILCNLVDCPASWVATSDWSHCSMTCGEGIETRLILCQKVVAPGRVQNVSDMSICPDDKPESKRPCFNAACPQAPTEGHTQIEIDASRYVLLQPKGRVTLIVGGGAVLLPGTNIVVRCPARHYNRKLVYWRKNDVLIPRRGRIKMSRHGALHIKRSSPKDAGTFTCVVDANSSNITIGFHTPLEAERLLQDRIEYLSYNYKDVMKSRRQQAEDRTNSISRNDYNNGQTKQVYRNTHNNGRYQESNLLISSIGAGVSENATSIPYIYVTTAWSACSQSCGFRGLQWRNVTCELITETYLKVVDGSECARMGLSKPLVTQDCGMQQCPHWEIGPWSLCTNSQCSRNGVGTSRRTLYCVEPNGTTISVSHCDTGSEPPSRRECRQDSCTAVWKVSQWSKCSKSCGGLGMKRRTLRCVWYNNQLPAGPQCKGTPKPSTDKVCSAPTCHHMVCKDKSTTCSMIPRLQLCHIWYRECCRSCRQR